MTDRTAQIEEVSSEGAVYPAPTPYPNHHGRGQASTSIRRRLGKEQGQAIERLGHAVEYLIDSRMFLTQVPYTQAEEDAVQILMRLNRMVFDSCPEVVPIGRRVAEGLGRLLARADRKAA